MNQRMPSLLYFWGPGPSFLLSPRDRSALSFYIACSLLFSCQRTCCLLSSPPFLISAVLAIGLLDTSYFFFFCVSSGSCPFSHVPQLSWEKVNISLLFSARVIMHAWPQHKAHSTFSQSNHTLLAPAQGTWPQHFGSCWLCICCFSTGMSFIVIAPVPRFKRQIARKQRLYSLSWIKYIKQNQHLRVGLLCHACRLFDTTL